MSPYELLSPGGCNDYYHYNEVPGIDWIRRFLGRYPKMVWLNPLPPERWQWGYGSSTIRTIEKEVPMYPLTVKGLEEAMKYLISARGRRETA